MANDKSLTGKIREFFAETFPNVSPKDALAGSVAEAVLGAIPPYSNRTAYHICPTTVLTAAAYTIPYRPDRSGRDPLILMVQRKDKNERDDFQIGLPGGFVNLDFEGKSMPAGGNEFNTAGEQPRVGAKRELQEEIVSGDGERRPILNPEINRFELVDSVIDYRRTRSPACFNNAYGLSLNEIEYHALEDHQSKMSRDPHYRDSAIAASDGEVTGIRFIKLSELLKIIDENSQAILDRKEDIAASKTTIGKVGAFTHPHEMNMIKAFAEQFQAKQQRVR